MEQMKDNVSYMKEFKPLNDEDKAIIEKYPYFEQIYSGTNNSRVRPRTTKWSQIETVFGEELVKCIEGSQSVDATIKNSQKAIDNLRNE